MPVYEYRCLSCKKKHELIQKFSDEPLKECPDCGGPVNKLISNTSFVLKGSGWYVTDYASPERKRAMDRDNGKKSSPETKKPGTKKKDSGPKAEKKDSKSEAAAA